LALLINCIELSTSPVTNTSKKASILLIVETALIILEGQYHKYNSSIKRACPINNDYAKIDLQLDITTMGQHRSLQASGGAASKKRNVMKRFERVELLEKRGQWKDGDRVVGLRKTKPEA